MYVCVHANIYNYNWTPASSTYSENLSQKHQQVLSVPTNPIPESHSQLCNRIPMAAFPVPSLIFCGAHRSSLFSFPLSACCSVSYSSRHSCSWRLFSVLSSPTRLVSLPPASTCNWLKSFRDLILITVASPMAQDSF